jgi:hypothetical protein
MNNAIIRYAFDKKKQVDNSKKTGLLQIEIPEEEVYNIGLVIGLLRRY